MTAHKKEIYTKTVWVFTAVALVGVGILLYESINGYSDRLLSSLIVLVISIAALVMTTLQGVSAQRQLRMTENLLRKTNQSSHEMEELVSEDKKLRKEILEDMKLDREVIAILEHYGVGANKDERQKVAQAIAKLPQQKQE